ncbi:caffeoyl-CoA O-methyltransferase [Auricularia subglabra TFB-10046 SS5]|uniref:Caffeoyl-CoA O-methyltransferase n=1 Tax=Auricularia subglabra (strain TFB-10046 / SS5) TaxID=717982 RepID=J0WNW7_AURST|nr:caffeoyl-CoA O-methyltransferase [Auricularia subglabra TFB-10046 SS5]
MSQQPTDWLGDTPAERISKLLARLDTKLAASLSPGDEAFSLLSEARAVLDGMDGYMEQHSTPYPPILDEMMRAIDTTEWAAVGSEITLAPNMCAGGYEAGVLCMMAKMCGARRILEIGMFAGTTTVALALVPEVEQVVSLEYEPFLRDFAKPFFERAGVEDKIDVRVGDARETLKVLHDEGLGFDMVFIDADKGGYPTYFKSILDFGLLAPKGIIVLDNTLYKGTPYAPHEVFDDGVAGISEVNRLARTDDRVDVVILPIRDGITIARRR